MIASDLHHASARQPDGFTQIVEFTPQMRVLIADAIEALILLLDEIDGDADFEDEAEDADGDEGDYSLGLASWE